MERIYVKPQFKLRQELTLPKDRRYRNEDSYQSSDRRGIYALSDGASISYDSASWARILVRRFAQFPVVDDQWLDGAVADFQRLHNRDSMTWMQQAAFDRGSFASLLGVRYAMDTETIHIFAIGDSLAVLCDGNEIKATFPYQSQDQFDSPPQLLSTNKPKNSFLSEAIQNSKLVVDWPLKGLAAPSLFCVTDALGRWLLERQNETPSPIILLRKIVEGGRKQFTNFVRSERAAKRMRLDDTTMLALW